MAKTAGAAAEGDKGPPVKSSKGGKAVDAAALRAEVQAFASRLGLAAGDDGFDDRDFRPQPPQPEAKSKVKAVNGKTRQPRQQPGGPAGPGPAPRQRPEGEGRGAAAAGRDEKKDRPKGREWNAGAGRRPGERSRASLPRVFVINMPSAPGCPSPQSCSLPAQCCTLQR